LFVVFLALDGLVDLNAVRNIAKRVCYRTPIPRKTPSFILTINGVKPITALASYLMKMLREIEGLGLMMARLTLRE